MSEHIQINICCLSEGNIWMKLKQISITCSHICLWNNEDESACAMHIIIIATYLLIVQSKLLRNGDFC
jgi:hypothetical protein